jgi:hypothetical protein
MKISCDMLVWTLYRPELVPHVVVVVVVVVVVHPFV